MIKIRSIINGISYSLIGIIVYFFSIYIFGFYTAGDQAYYIEFYKAISDVKFDDISLIAYRTIGSQEPLSLSVLWLGSNVLNIDKTVWVSILNSAFMVLFYRFLIKNNTSLIVVILLFTCFYTSVMLFSAERLKLAFICIFLAFNTAGLTRSILFLISPLFHFQVLAFFPVVLIYQLSGQLKNIFFKFKISVSMVTKLLFVIIVIVFIITLNYDGFMHKFDSYFYREKTNNAQFMTFLKILLFAAIAVKETKNKLCVGASFLPMFLFGFMFGGQRIVIMAFAMFVYFLAVEGKLFRPLPFIILLYFSIKVVPFYTNIFNFGSGFLVPEFMN